MVVWVGHIHATLHPFFIFPGVELAPLVLGSIITARSGLTDIFEFTCRQTGRVARLHGSSLGCIDGRVSGSLLVLVTFLFKGCGQSNQNLVVIGTLLVPFSSRLLVSIKVDHVRDEVTGVESGGLFYPLSSLALHVGKEISVGSSQLVEGECE